MAVKIAVNAKVQRPGVCNAMETLLVHADIADAFLPAVIPALRKEGVEIRGCERTRRYSPEVVPAQEEDWETEYLDLILAVKVVDSLDEAIEHINRTAPSTRKPLLPKTTTGPGSFSTGLTPRRYT